MRVAVLAIGLFALPVTAATLQEQYAAAQVALDAGRMAEARRGFAAVLPRLDANPKMKMQAAVVRARMGSAALLLNEPEAALGLIAAAVSVLPAGSGDWIAATLDLGLTQEQVIDFDAAAKSYRAVIAAAQPGDGAWLTATIGAARTLMFSDPAAARVYADDALRVGATVVADKQKRGGHAQLLALRGRIELAAGQPKTARTWLDKALVEGRSLTAEKISLADVRIRGDAGLAAFFAGDFDATRKYLAYSGAGGLQGEGFELGADMPLPSCAPVGVLARDDMAVIEFRINNDGRVTGVVPVYATNAVAAMEFARAVRGWSWLPEVAVKLIPFWRAAVRLELRCANRGPDAANKIDYGSDSRAWVAAQNPLTDLPPAEAAALPALRAELARRVAVDGPTSPRLVPILLSIMSNGIRKADEAVKAVASARLITETSGAPQDLLLYLRLRSTEIGVEVLASNRSWGTAWRDTARSLEKLLADFDREGLGTTRGAALVAVRIGAWTAVQGGGVRQAAAYRRVLATPLTALPDGDPLRQIARLGLASSEAAAARLDSARSLLAETGLSAEQCSTVPVPPVMMSSGVSSGDFPKEAMRWGFEGNVRVAYDIDTTGRPVGVRTVVAHPPLVFNEATEKLARGLRYKPVFRDGATIGCADMQKGVTFRVGTF